MNDQVDGQTCQTGDDVLDSLESKKVIAPSESTGAADKKLILDRWGLTHEKFTKLVDENPSLRGVTLGYVAEMKFHEMFLSHPDVNSIRKDADHNRKRKGDRTFSYKGQEFIVEVKSLQTATAKQKPDGTYVGKSQVDASDKREVTFKDDTKLATTCLLRGEFDILAVNCYAFGNEWKFAFARNDKLPQNTHDKYKPEQRAELLPTTVVVHWPPVAPYSTDPFTLMDEILAERAAGQVPMTPEPDVKKIED